MTDQPDFTPSDPVPAVAPALLGTAVRYAVTAGAAALAKTGLAPDNMSIDNDPAFWTGVATLLTTVIWGLYSRWKRTHQLRQAIAAPAGKAK